MIKAVVGANWGDEGKGKITDMLDRAIAGLSLAREGRGEARKQELEQVRDGLQDMKKEWDGWQR